MSKKNINPEKCFVVGVGDLLHKPGTKDQVSITNENCVIDGIGNIGGKVELVALNDYELVATISVMGDFHTICDYCGTDLVIAQKPQKEIYNFMREGRIEENDMKDSSIYPIMNDMTIDLYPVIREVMLLSDIASHVCIDCQNRLKDQDTSLPESNTHVVFK